MRSKLVGWVSAVSLAVTLITSSPARADEWYGYQTLAADGVATGLVVGAIATHGDVSKTFFALSASTYIIASPVIHAANERGGAAVGALGLRLGAPVSFGLLGLVVGAASDSHANWGAPLLGGLIGVGLGVITAMVIDAAVLARKETRVAQGASAITVGSELYVPFGGTF